MQSDQIETHFNPYTFVTDDVKLDGNILASFDVHSNFNVVNDSFGAFISTSSRNGSSSNNSTPKVQESTLERFYEETSDRIILFFSESGYSEGIKSIADSIIEDTIETKGLHKAHNLVATLWRKSYCPDNSKKNYAPAVLNCIANLSDKLDNKETLATIAASALASLDIETQEAGIALFEYWDDVKFLSYLKGSQKSDSLSVREYKESVIEELESRV